MARLFSNTGTFRSLANYNYRLWAGGAIVSNVGTWMQRVAQDWLVLTQLTHNSASAVGTVMALQFGPQMLMLPFSGFAADFFDRRKLLMATQAAMGLCALGLGCLRVRLPAWLCRGVRRAGTAGLRFGPGGRDRPAERRGAELHLVQRRTHGGSCPRGPADRGRRNGLGLPRERLVVRRRAVLARLPERGRSPSDPPGQPRAGRLRRRLPLCVAPPRSQGDPPHAVPDRHVRHELLDLHLDHGGQGLPPGRGQIRDAVR
jgi:hypothetical protein